MLSPTEKAIRDGFPGRGNTGLRRAIREAVKRGGRHAVLALKRTIALTAALEEVAETVPVHFYAEFSYAVPIQPRNGQQLVEYTRGLAGTFRLWDDVDRSIYPRAENQIASDPETVLVVDTDFHCIYAVDRAECDRQEVNR